MLRRNAFFFRELVCVCFNETKSGLETKSRPRIETQHCGLTHIHTVLLTVLMSSLNVRVKNTTLYFSSCPSYGSLKRVVGISLFLDGFHPRTE